MLGGRSVACPPPYISVFGPIPGKTVRQARPGIAPRPAGLDLKKAIPNKKAIDQHLYESPAGNKVGPHFGCQRSAIIRISISNKKREMERGGYKEAGNQGIHYLLLFRRNMEEGMVGY